MPTVAGSPEFLQYLNAIPKENIATPIDMATYQKYLSTPVGMPKFPSVADIPSAVKTGYDTIVNPTDEQGNPKVDTSGNPVHGSKWLGVPLAALAGLGKIGEVMNTSTGGGLMAGATTSADNPYIGESWAGQRGLNRQNEINQIGIARQLEQGRISSIGDLIKEQEKNNIGLTETVAPEVIRLLSPETQARINQIKTDTEKSGAETGKTKTEAQVLPGKSAEDIEALSQKTLIDKAKALGLNKGDIAAYVQSGGLGDIKPSFSHGIIPGVHATVFTPYPIKQVGDTTYYQKEGKWYQK